MNEGILWVEFPGMSLPVAPIHENRPKMPHVTLAYGVSAEQYADFIGRQVPIMLTGVAHSERVQAVAVELPEGIPFAGNHLPHITVSFADGVKPVEAGAFLASAEIKPLQFQIVGEIAFFAWK